MNAAKHVTFLILALVARILLADEQPKLIRGFLQRTFGVVVSKETTHITEPLADDGYVDYLAAVNSIAQQGVTVESNAAVFLWQAIGPDAATNPEWDEFDPSEYFGSEDFRVCGDPPLARGDYFVEYDDFITATSTESHEPDDGANLASKARNELRQVTSHPWTSHEFPLVAKWLQKNERPVQLAKQASRRSRYYSPITWIWPPEKMGAAHTLHYGFYDDCLLRQIHSLPEALIARAMLRAGQGKFNQAWDDLLATHRLARLVAQCPLLGGCVVAEGVELIAQSATISLVTRVPLSMDQLVQIRTDRNDLRGLPPYSDKIDVAGRYEYLDLVSRMPRKNLGFFLYLNPRSRSRPIMWVSGQVFRWSTDWNEVLRHANAHFDRSTSLARITTRALRDKLQREEQQQSYTRYFTCRERWEQLRSHPLLMYLTMRKNATDTISATLLYLMGDASINVDNRDRTDQLAGLTEITIALALHEKKRQSYPDHLDELVPEYLATIPVDPFSADGFRYRRLEAGFLLYSIGSNGEDDGGEAPAGDGSWNSGEPDDVAVRMPP